MSVQPAKYCADCGAVIAGPSTPRNVYNRIKYCRECAEERKRWSKANWQLRSRREKKERNRLIREQAALLRKENSELRVRISVLEKMNQEARGYV